MRVAVLPLVLAVVLPELASPLSSADVTVGCSPWLVIAASAPTVAAVPRGRPASFTSGLCPNLHCRLRRRRAALALSGVPLGAVLELTGRYACGHVMQGE